MHLFTVIDKPSVSMETNFEIVAVQDPAFPIPIKYGDHTAVVPASVVAGIIIWPRGSSNQRTVLTFIGPLQAHLIKTLPEQLRNARSATLNEELLSRDALLATCVELPQADETDELTPKRLHMATLTEEFLKGVDESLGMHSSAAAILIAAAAKWGRKYTLVLMEDES